MTLRFLSYLAPSLPEELFDLIVQFVARRLGISTTLEFETSRSGPTPTEHDPIETGRIDVAFLCAPTLEWLRKRRSPPAELLPAALIPCDPRARGEPVFFADVIVPKASPVQAVSELRDRRWAFNDPCSLSGYWCIVEEYGGDPVDGIASGSHLRSIEWIASGHVDAAAIDSNVLALHRVRHPELDASIRVVHSWGPYPIQPIVVRSTLDEESKQQLTSALLELHECDETTTKLREFAFERFGPVTEAHYRHSRSWRRHCDTE